MSSQLGRHCLLVYEIFSSLLFHLISVCPPNISGDSLLSNGTHTIFVLQSLRPILCDISALNACPPGIHPWPRPVLAILCKQWHPQGITKYEKQPRQTKKTDDKKNNDVNNTPRPQIEKVAAVLWTCLCEKKKEINDDKMNLNGRLHITRAAPVDCAPLVDFTFWGDHERRPEVGRGGDVTRQQRTDTS